MKARVRLNVAVFFIVITFFGMGVALAGPSTVAIIAAAITNILAMDVSCQPLDSSKLSFPVVGTFRGLLCFDKKQYDKAHDWWIRAVTDSNEKWAQFYLGVLYSKNDGGFFNDHKANEWYRKAADQGLAHAQYNLAIRLSQGIGGKQDESAAVIYLSAAADQGLAEAQYELGMRYLRADSLPSNEFLSYIWLSSASKGGLTAAGNQLSEIQWTLDEAEIYSANGLSDGIYKAKNMDIATLFALP